jgi:hypothetical protein
MPGPGGGGGQINSLMDLMQPQQPVPPRTYGSWDPELGYYMQPSPPLYSGGGVGAMGVGGGGGGRAFSPPQELAGYFDQYGNPRIDDPRQVAADAGVSPGQLASGFFPRYGKDQWGQGYEYPSDKGGFFKVEDLYGLTGTPGLAPAKGPQRPGGPGANMQVVREGAQAVPHIGTLGMSSPSTNNWRLLGMGPGWIMRNGFLINTRSGGGRWGGPAGWAPTGGNTGEQSMPAAATSLGAGQAYGVPNMLQAGLGQPVTYGWPGATQWFHDPGSTPNAGLGG